MGQAIVYPLFFQAHVGASFAQAHATFLVHSGAVPLPPESLYFPFLKFTLTHRGSAKHMAEHGVGLQPNVACEFKTGRLS